jgi:hypothetical protein
MRIPLFGNVGLATALIFDIGVYLVVTGGCITIITGIGQSNISAEKSDKKAALRQEGER